MFSAIPKFAIKRPVCIFICVLSLIVFGTSSVFQMPLESTPEVEMPVLMIMTSYYGASPEEIDQSVTDRIEVALSTISEVDSVTSMSIENMGMTVLQFYYGVDIDKKYQDVTSALAMITLPDDAQKPTIIEMNMSAMNSSIMSLSVEANAGDDLKNYVEDNIVPELKRIKGVSDVSVFGGARQYIQILLDENKMTQYGLTMSAVSNAIATSEFELTMGSLDRGNITVDLTGSQKIKNYRALEDVPITLASGDVIHVSDVAQVIMTEEEQESYSRRNGMDAISLSITKEQSGNTVGICQQVVKEVERLNNSGLGITLEVSYNSGEDIMENIKQVVLSLVEGLAIAVAVLWLFLGEWKASAIVAISMPLSVLTALIIMSFLGMTINMMSLGGLVIGIGMLVDNSIVVIDSCFKSSRELGGRSFRERVIQGAELVTSSVIASTLTTVVVFLPIAMIKGISGQLFHDVAYTIVFSLTASLASAITLVPLLFVQLQPHERTGFIAYRILGRVEEWYGGIISGLLHRRKLVVTVAVLLMVVAVVLFAMVPQELMPSMSSGTINLNVQTKNGLNLESTNSIMEELEQLVSQHPDVESYSMSVGSGGGMGALMGGGAGSVSVTLREDAALSDEEFVQEIRDQSKAIPNCNVEVSANDMMSMLSSQSVDITLQGPDLTVLEETANGLRDLMAQMPEFDGVTTSLADGAPRAEIVVDPILAASARMTPMAVLGSVRSQLTGIEAMTIQDGDTEYSVKVELPLGRFVDISDLYGMMIDTPTGGQAALTDMAEIVYTEAPTAITRVDREYQVTVSGTPRLGNNVSQLTAKVLQTVGTQLELPAGVEMAQGNMMDMMMEEFAAIGNAMLVALYLVFAVMAVQFESLRFPIVVLISVPFAMVGSFLGLAITGSSVNMASLLGLVMLEGIVVNNAIVLIDYVNVLRRENNVEIHEALVRAGKMRLRPILMSSLTTIVGLLPMAVGSGVEMMESMAIVVIGGLIMSTLLTLILIPTFYLIFDKEDRRRRKEEKRARRAARKEAKAALKAPKV